MRIRALSFALVAASALLLSTTTALAAPVELTVRIEGESRTLFEGPILTDGHDIRSASDSASRRCDGTNGAANPGPGPTPTAASVDAMAIAGQDFDAKWFSGMSDYYVERWGPDRESFTANDGGGAFWGLLVNGVFTTVGGCQVRAAAGDEVLWAYDAFNLSKAFLTLTAGADPTARVAYVEVGEPLELSVQELVYSGELGVPPGVEPAAGVPVGLVATDPATGFQTVGEAQAASDGDGSAEVSFATSGWKRLKASRDDGFIRSNRLDVCVRPPGGDCGPAPADALLRVPPPPGDGDGAETPPTPAPSPGPAPNAAPTPAAGGDSAGKLSFARKGANRRNGTATVAVGIPAPGRLVLSGNLVRRAVAQVGAARTVRLVVRPKPGARKRLLGKGRLTAKVSLRFQPRQGRPQTIHRSVTLVLAR